MEKQQQKTTAVGSRIDDSLGTKPKTWRAETEERWLYSSKWCCFNSKK
jgi:hypothetical protein